MIIFIGSSGTPFTLSTVESKLGTLLPLPDVEPRPDVAEPRFAEAGPFALCLRAMNCAGLV